jgi:dipeptidyl aminopeptidase/acylaminoacyl peptidase
MKYIFATVILILSLTLTSNALEKGTLIPREILFGNPVKDQPQISPDGTMLAYLAPSNLGVLNVWIKSLDKNDDRMVTKDEKQGIHFYTWAYNNSHILYFQDRFGDENEHLFSAHIRTAVVRDLTPFKGSKAQTLHKDPDYPDEVLVGVNVRDQKVFDMHRINLKTAEIKLDTQNPGDVIGWMTDYNFVIRAATVFNPADQSTILRVRDTSDKPWRDLVKWPFEDSNMLGQVNGGSMTVGFTKEGNHIYVTSSLNSNTLRLEKIPLRTREAIQVMAEDPKADIWTYESADGTDVAAVEMIYNKGQVDAVVVNYDKPRYLFLNPEFEKDILQIQKAHEGFPFVENIDLSRNKWIVSFEGDVTSVAYYLYDRSTKKLSFLFDHLPGLKNYKLAKVEPVEIKSRDGLTLVGYLALPPDGIKKNLPLVISPHGGPWFRDQWDFNPEQQWLANRGYAVLYVNFRGSTGYGKKFLNASNGEWGRNMQNDISDSVQWAVNQGIADPKRVAIFGGSYGGYATLAGITFTPELYACAIDLVGPSNVASLLASFPEYWKPVKARWIRRIGDAENDEVLNKRISPLFHVDKIRVPLLIAHGANDPRVKLNESEAIVNAMREKNLPVTFVVYPDEGHGFQRPENMFDFYGRAEEFLGKCLGGKVEVWKKVEGSSAEVR